MSPIDASAPLVRTLQQEIEMLREALRKEKEANTGGVAKKDEMYNNVKNELVTVTEQLAELQKTHLKAKDGHQDAIEKLREEYESSLGQAKHQLSESKEEVEQRTAELLDVYDRKQLVEDRLRQYQFHELEQHGLQDIIGDGPPPHWQPGEVPKIDLTKKRKRYEFDDDLNKLARSAIPPGPHGRKLWHARLSSGITYERLNGYRGLQPLFDRSRNKAVQTDGTGAEEMF